MDTSGRVALPDVVDYFIDFYENRKVHGMIAEKSTSIYQKGGYTRKDVEKNILFCKISYPSCKHTEFIETEFVEEYFYHKGNKNGMLCPRCGCSLEARISRYGIYVQCCGGKRHKYGLDEI